MGVRAILNTDSKQSQGYLHWLDVAKGIGIILVVIGHCIFPCHALIDSFHIPLFFFIAGLTFSHKPLVTFVLSKTNRIAVPYIFFALISAVLALIPHPYSGSFNAPLWFLVALFQALVIMEIASANKCLAGAVALSALLLLYVTVDLKVIPDFLPWSLLVGLTAYIYLYAGYQIKQQLIIKTSPIKWGGVIACITSFCVAFVILYKDYGLTGGFYSLSLFQSHFVGVLICSFLGIFSTLLISQLIASNRLLEFFGRNSLVIMCVHFPLAQICNVIISHLPWYCDPVLRSATAVAEWIVVLGFSLLCVELCKRYIPKLTGYSPLIK